jgi:hypothetical protein
VSGGDLGTNLAGLRAEIDRIDEGMHRLLWSAARSSTA